MTCKMTFFLPLSMWKLDSSSKFYANNDIHSRPPCLNSNLEETLSYKLEIKQSVTNFTNLTINKSD